MSKRKHGQRTAHILDTDDETPKTNMCVSDDCMDNCLQEYFCIGAKDARLENLCDKCNEALKKRNDYRAHNAPWVFCSEMCRFCEQPAKEGNNNTPTALGTTTTTLISTNSTPAATITTTTVTTTTAATTKSDEGKGKGKR
jgi:hypothetical protein